MAKKSLTKTVAAEIGDRSSHNLSTFKKNKFLDKTSKFKKQTWIPFSPAVRDELKYPGFPVGHISVIRGHSDTGKTTLFIEAAIEAQKANILPVFIITEMKWDFEHAISMGFNAFRDVDTETGELLGYDGDFLYIDRENLNSIEDVSAFISDILNEQKKGKLPYDLLFLWDSIGSLPCEMSLNQGKNNPMWNAGAMAAQFGNFINQQIPLSRKESYPYTNTMIVVNKVGVRPPATPMEQPKRTNKAGDTMYWDASLVITFGNITNSGTSKINAQYKGSKVEFAKRTKIAIDKIHTGLGISSAGTVIVTPHGFIPDSKDAEKDYKSKWSHIWFNDTNINPDAIEVIEDSSEWNESNKTLMYDTDE